MKYSRGTLSPTRADSISRAPLLWIAINTFLVTLATIGPTLGLFALRTTLGEGINAIDITVGSAYTAIYLIVLGKPNSPTKPIRCNSSDPNNRSFIPSVILPNPPLSNADI